MTPLRTAAIALTLLLQAGIAEPAITIGPGPARGTDRAGVTWHEDFQDWTHGDLKALDNAGLADQTYIYGDGYDNSRDLLAFYFRDEGGNLYFRVDLYDLALAAENSALNIFLAIDAAPGGQSYLPDFMDCTTDHPWELCINLYQSGGAYGTDYRIYDQNFNNITTGYAGSWFNSQIDAVEFGVSRQTLINAGWDGIRTLHFQPFTSKDGGASSCPGHSRIADAFVDQDRGCTDGVLNGAIASTDTAGLVYYASIAHGNQSVNRAGDIGAHIYDPQSNTGISGGTGFLRTLDTHEIFRVPLNIHPSGTLTIACNWARRPGGASDPQDGPAFLARIRDFVDSDQTIRPGSLIGGTWAEQIMPFFEGEVNAASIALTDTLNRRVYGVTAASAGVMHIPERVIRSQPTGLSPLDGRTFEDIAASPYQASYLDEVTHLHGWFHPSETCAPDQGYRHRIHRINGVCCFMINDREDQAKFGNDDGGMVMDTRFSLLQKALYGNSSEIVVVFDDWEALAGKSFDPNAGTPIPNNNPNQYHNTIRWAANHPWIHISNLKDVLATALADPSAFIIDHGTRYDLPVQSYEWLKHASENSYNYWYYNNDSGHAGSEQDFYNLVPVITGPQGDYHARGATPADDGPPLPSLMRHGDLNTSGTLMHDAWAAVRSAPAGRLRELGIDSYLTMIYETAWHEEDQVDYSDTDCYGNWRFPDTSWDGLNTWALRLQNHVRWAGLYAAAARWAGEVRNGRVGPAAAASAMDLDFDGENEYILQNSGVFAVWEKYGGRCVLACAFNPATADAEVVIGAPFTNPSAPGEEELSGSGASRCSAFKEMNGGGYVDQAYSVVLGSGALQFTSADGRIVKNFSVDPGGYRIEARYTETLAGPLYVRLGLSPNPLDLAFNGHDHLTSALRGPEHDYLLLNSAGGGARILLGDCTFNPTPSFETADRRNLALTEEVELYNAGDASPFSFALELIPGAVSVSGAPDAGATPPADIPGLAVDGPWPSPGRGVARLSLSLAAPAAVRYGLYDSGGRRLGGADLGVRPAGTVRIDLSAAGEGTRAPLASGIYFVRIEAGGRSAVRRWVVVR